MILSVYCWNGHLLLALLLPPSSLLPRPRHHTFAFCLLPFAFSQKVKGRRQNALGKSQKAKREGKEWRNEEMKDEKEDGKKEKTKETEAADHSGKDLIPIPKF